MLTKANNVRRTLSVRLGLLAATSLLAATPVNAHDADSKFEMTVIRDAAYGSEIVSGDFHAAINKISTESNRPSQKFFAENNLCVAYTMSSEFDRATAACDAAIEITDDRMVFSGSQHSTAFYRALALTNRGVLRAMVGKTGEARGDFEEARLLRAGIAAAKRNLTHLDTRLTQARID